MMELQLLLVPWPGKKMFHQHPGKKLYNQAKF
jgi:hypothetical protein